MKKDKVCCDVMRQYRCVVSPLYFSAGAASDIDNSVSADKDEIHLSTGFESATLPLNYCPACGKAQSAIVKRRS